MVDAWLIPLNSGMDEQYCRSILSQEELAKAARFRFPRDRALSVAARSALRVLLGRNLGLAPASLKFEYEPGGRPVLAASLAADPPWFSVSHAGEMVAIAISRYRVGIDIECIGRSVEFEPLLRYLPADEAAENLALPKDQRRRAFLCGWTRKEARLKASGEGLAGVGRDEAARWRNFDISRGYYCGSVATVPECVACLMRYGPLDAESQELLAAK